MHTSVPRKDFGCRGHSASWLAQESWIFLGKDFWNYFRAVLCLIRQWIHAHASVWGAFGRSTCGKLPDHGVLAVGQFVTAPCCSCSQQRVERSLTMASLLLIVQWRISSSICGRTTQQRGLSPLQVPLGMRKLRVQAVWQFLKPCSQVEGWETRRHGADASL